MNTNEEITEDKRTQKQIEMLPVTQQSCNILKMPVYPFAKKLITPLLTKVCNRRNIHNVNDSVLTQAQVVIAGAGVVANSVAYHLSKYGWNDVLVLEQDKIGSGTSHFGSGTLGLFKPIADRNIILYSIKLYKEIEELGYNTGFKQCGSVYLAQTKDRMIALKRRMAYNLPTGLHCELVNIPDLQKLHPYLNIDDLEGAVWVPDDAIADPKAICDTLATLAQSNGVTYMENCTVQTVLTDNCTVTGVVTDKGEIRCEYFVNCAGMWARELGLQCVPPVRIPAYPAEHIYVLTEPMNDQCTDQLPCIRDYDSHTYMREYNRGFMIGWFEENARPAFTQNIVPKNWQQHLQKNVDRFYPHWEKAMKRLPVLRNCTKQKFINSPDNFTPDGRWILGESSEVNNYFVAVGMNGNLLQGAGGIGRAVAEWIIEGKPTQELLPFNVQRFQDVHNSRRYLKQRIKEVVGRHYSILYPHQCEYNYARKLRCSPLYSVLEKRGAVFGIKMAYERALYFDSTYQSGDPLPKMPPGSFYKPKFFDFMKEEYLACREGVGIIDMSSFSKIEIKSSGTQVISYLQKLCSNDVNIPVGGIVHTGMQNEIGGYENDCMLVRQSENSFFMVSPTSQQTRVYEWISRYCPKNQSIHLNDVTSMYTVINVVGPKAAELLSELSNSDMALMPFSYKKVNVGYASDVMVMSFTHTGEPGYCLYVPSEYALHVYYRLMTVGKDYGVRDVGTLTQRFMRIERFIPFWAEELTNFTTPYEAGNGYSVKLDKSDFIGKKALQKQKDQGVHRQLVLFHLNDIDPDKDIWPWGGEPLYRNNEFVGTVTSAGYGFTADKLVCLGFIQRPKSDTTSRIVNAEYSLSRDAVYKVDIAGYKFRLTPYLHAPHISIVSHQNRRYKPTVVNHSNDVVH
ncbi:uncharacterized protein CBL_14312 [Carabus blaptoides fortunei]